MAYVHESGGWIPATGRQVKSCTTIDEDTLELFKSVIAENAQYYERTYVAALTKAWAEEIKAARIGGSNGASPIPPIPLQVPKHKPASNGFGLLKDPVMSLKISSGGCPRLRASSFSLIARPWANFLKNNMACPRREQETSSLEVS
jgi:hypothetical protein